MNNCKVLSRARSHLYWLVGVAVMASGCDQSATNILAVKLSNGHELGDLLAESPSGMIVLVSPGQCLTCDRRLRELLSAYPTESPRIPLVFTRLPSGFELRRFALEGIPRGLPYLVDSLADQVSEPIAVVRRGGGPSLVMPLAEADAIVKDAKLSAADSARNNQPGRFDI